MASLTHRLLTRVIPVVRDSGDVADLDAFAREKLAEQARARTDPPARLLRGFEVTRLEGYGFPVHDLRVAGTSPQRSWVYLHGGAYVSEADRAHWRYVARAARDLDARIVFPVYPLAPRHTWRDSTPDLLRLVEQVAIESPQGVTLAGDSAGGGYALALAQQLARRPGPQPRNLLLISPWVDLTSSVPGTVAAAARDPWLNFQRLQASARLWAGEDDPARPEVSPLFGEMEGLPPTMVLCGTRDTLHPQVAELVGRMRRAGTPVVYVEEPDLLHVYPVLPVPEARRAWTEVRAWLDGGAPEGRLTYRPVGATRGELPGGFDHLRLSRVVGHGERDFRVAGEALMRWQVQRRTGVRVEGSDRVAEGAAPVLRLGLGRLALRAPALVVYVVDEPSRRGFAYGTRPGHPESGEESFVVELRPDGAVEFTVTAYTRTAVPPAPLTRPVYRVLQRLVVGRYLRTLERLVREAP